MNCIDCKLIKNTILYGILTLVTIVFCYNFIDLKVTDIIYSSDILVQGISTFASLFSKIFSLKYGLLLQY